MTLRGLLLDVGFTLTTYDSPRIAALAGEKDVVVTATALRQAERAYRAELPNYQLSHSKSPDLDEGARFMAALLLLAGAKVKGVPKRRHEEFALATFSAGLHIWESHLQKNLWSQVLPGVKTALKRAREGGGLKLAAVSNSEGTVEAALKENGLAEYLDVIIDSAVVKVKKPDPDIFRIALAELDLHKDEVLMIGDSPEADLEGAKNAGIQAVLIDPYGLHPTKKPRFLTVTMAIAQILEEEKKFNT